MSYDLYMEDILEHYKHPLNSGSITQPQLHIKDSNPLCGDQIEIFANVYDGAIQDIKFQGSGCAISVAATSKLLESVKGKTLQDIRTMEDEQVFTMLNVNLSPIRIKCALLSLRALQKAIVHHQGAQQ